MGLRLLLDEDTERDLAIKLSRAGHDVERVVSVVSLGPGAEDSEVRAYADRTDRIIVTHDDDHVAAPDEYAGVFYAPNQQLSAFRLFRIINQVADSFPDQNSIPPVVYLTEDWLR